MKKYVYIFEKLFSQLYTTMEQQKWPICPSFISLADKKTEELADFNNDGIYYPDYIRGFLADLSHDKRVQNALSMFQIVPKDFIALDENNRPGSTDKQYITVLDNIPLDERIKKIIGEDKKMIRIDSGTFIKNGICCDIFRNCLCTTKQRGGYTKIEFCYKQDSRAGIFADRSLSFLDPGTPEYKESLEKIIDEFNLSEENPISKMKLGISEGRVYVHYTCTESLFEETMFPIYAKGRFVACLMLGQMATENYDRNMSFTGFLAEKHCDETKCKEITNSLPSEKLSHESWNKKLDAIIQRIKIFETRLEDKINSHSENYIKDEFRKIKEQFNEQTKKIKIKDNDTPTKFYDALSKALTSIHNTFDSTNGSFMRIFALPMDNESDKYIPIGWSETNGISYYDKQDNYFFIVKSLNQIKEKLNTLPLCKEQMQEIVEISASKEIQKQYNKEQDIIRPEKLIDDSVSFIVWKRHTNSEIKNDKKVFDAYVNALLSFYTTAFQSYLYIRGAKMEYMLETTIRTTAHEASHFTLPALDVVEKKMKIIPQEMILPVYAEEYLKLADAYEHYRENVIELLMQLSEINTVSTLIFKEAILEKEPTQVFPLLYKMKKLMRDIAHDNSHNIIYSQKDNYVEVDLDPIYFNHAIFNLVDNAIKYGYEGSHIYIHMNKTHDELIIKVISYGHQIEEGRRIYRLFERGIDYQEVKGMGIGMFIIDKICRAHGGTIKHESIEISPLNVPVLKAYKDSRDEYLLRELKVEEKEAIYKEVERLTTETFCKVVHSSKFVVKRPYTFATRIFKPTYQNTFTITLPI